MRRALQVCVIALGLTLIGGSALTTLGAERYVEATLLPRVGARLGAAVTAGDVTAIPGRVVLRDVAVTPTGHARPLVVVHEIDARYSLLSLLSDERLEIVRVRGIDLRIDAATGLPALRDLLARARHEGDSEGSTPSAHAALPALTVRELRLAYDDPAGLHAQARVDAAFHGQHGRALVRGLRVWGPGAPVFRARAATVDYALGQGLSSAAAEQPVLVVREIAGAWEMSAIADRVRAALDVLKDGGAAPARASGETDGPFRIEVHRARAEIVREGTTLVADDIHGWVTRDPAHHAVSGRLSGKVGLEATWEIQAEGDLERGIALGHARLAALPLPELLPLLPRVPVDWTAATRLSGEGNFKYEDAPGRLALDGSLRADGLTVTSAMIAPEPLRDLTVDVSGRGALWIRSREVALSDGRIAVNGVALLVHGDVARSGGLPRVTADVTLPPTPCNDLLRSMPTALVAHLGGLELEGVFGADLHVVLDLERPEHTDVRFDVGNECRLLGEEYARVDRLRQPFVQRAVSDGQMVEFVTGPGSPGWTPYEQISPNLVGAVLTTEDGGFFSHSGFSAESIRRALVRDLREGRFVVGGSTISMQLAKNVFLGHEKTIARKLQEAVLTWMLEQSMAKEEILELYFNVIEYGPGLYGIRNAARHFFGVSPADLSPIQAVYIATLLPNPVHRYATFLRGSPTPALMDRLHRVLRLMAQRGHLDGSLEDALAEPLVFRGGSEVAEHPTSDDDEVVQ